MIKWISMRTTIKKVRLSLQRAKIEGAKDSANIPDFPGRLRAIYGKKQLALSGAKLIARDRDRY